MGGIPDPRAQLADLIVRLRILSLIAQLTRWSLIKHRPAIQLFWQACIELMPRSLARYFAEEAKLEPWISKQFAKHRRISIQSLQPGAPFFQWLPTRRGYLAGIIAMSNKLSKFSPPALATEEVRYPYLDQTLLEFTASIPATQLLKPGQRRSLMRRSLIGVVPESVLSRRTKQFGSRTPAAAFDKQIVALRKAFAQPISSAFGYVNHDRILAIIDATRSGAEVHIVRLLRTVSLEFWLQELAARRLMTVNPSMQGSFAMAVRTVP